MEVSGELDRAVPRQERLLDNTAAKHRSELVHRSDVLASRHKPSGGGLRSQILRPRPDSRADSPGLPSAPSFSAALLPTTSSGAVVPPPAPPPTPPSAPPPPAKKATLGKSKPGLSFLSDLQSSQKTKCREDSAEREQADSDLSASDGVDVDRKETVTNTKSPVSSKPNFLKELENTKKPSMDTSEISFKVLKKPRAKPSAPAAPKLEIADQLRLKLEARKKLVEENDEGVETEVC